MEIRRATVADWEVVREIRLHSLRDAPQAFCSVLEVEQKFDDQSWLDRITRSAIFLAWSGGKPVGTVAGTIDTHEEGSREFVGMWVDPVARGAGVASVLIDAVASWASTERAQSLALWVADDNVGARRLYEKYGFALTGEREAMRPGVEQLRMRKPLAPSEDAT